ncbi:medium-chain acyl-CoA ligase ACSF2, mitochondrial-like [Pollicipes pollicipes]|uniref:medium-chain acyl-CoA ligase ACSF2, mitochondrial-like n=1 Tax=Pollicipes pollicipes TaxID=41117 RepID=UPI0018849604|nr:medium-chain acyl-CoA ligase ACSF2, mitochondrial-like [Pollicipes pollicipes]
MSSMLRQVVSRAKSGTLLRAGEGTLAHRIRNRLASGWSYVSCPGNEPLRDLTVGDTVDRAAEGFGHREALVSCFEGIRKTYGEVKEEADRLAAGLLRLGLQRGDRLAMWGPNCYHWYLTQFAAAKAGLVFVTINPVFRPEELEYCLNKVGVRALVCPPALRTQEYYKFVCEVAPELPNSPPGSLQSTTAPDLRHVITLGDQQLPGTVRLTDVLDSATSTDVAAVHDLAKRIQFDEPCNIQFTSGTTGRAKAATLSHHNIVNNSYFVGKRFCADQTWHRALLSVPMFHCFGCVAANQLFMQHGGTIVLAAPVWDKTLTLDTIESEHATLIYGTPTMFIDLSSCPDLAQRDLHTLELGVSGGAPLPVKVMQEVMQRIGMKNALMMYGMTETSPNTFQSFPEDDLETRVGSIGFPQDHLEAKVVDTAGTVVPRGTPGELMLRGYANFLGYWGDEEATRQIFTADRWLKTGDLATMDERGYGRIIGRKKDMVIRGGENIFPKEVEDLLTTHPAVLEAYVIGVPDERLGEELCAFIRLKPGQIADAEDLRAHCQQHVAAFKTPRYWRFRDDFPRTTTGKVQKFKLSEFV